jgi:hypothetical protein
VVWAVTLASRYIPRATCLTQAFTAQILLNRAGLENRLCVGVARVPSFGAHAWVERAGTVLVGGAEQCANYTTIFTLEGYRRRYQL